MTPENHDEDDRTSSVAIDFIESNNDELAAALPLLDNLISLQRSAWKQRKIAEENFLLQVKAYKQRVHQLSGVLRLRDRMPVKDVVVPSFFNHQNRSMNFDEGPQQEEEKDNVMPTDSENLELFSPETKNVDLPRVNTSTPSNQNIRKGSRFGSGVDLRDPFDNNALSIKPCDGKTSSVANEGYILMPSFFDEDSTTENAMLCSSILVSLNSTIRDFSSTNELFATAINQSTKIHNLDETPTQETYIVKNSLILNERTPEKTNEIPGSDLFDRKLLKCLTYLAKVAYQRNVPLIGLNPVSSKSFWYDISAKISIAAQHCDLSPPLNLTSLQIHDSPASNLWVLETTKLVGAWRKRKELESRETNLAVKHPDLFPLLLDFEEATQNDNDEETQ